nr:hypothetical protein [Streptomyces sp. QL37]
MPASTCARTLAGSAAAYWPWLNIVARSPFCLRALSRAGVLPEGPSSKVSPTYPLQAALAAAWEGVVSTATVAVAAVAATASAVTAGRRDRRDVMRMRVSPFSS